MKKYLLLIVFSTSFGAFKSFGQVYEKIYSLSNTEVQSHMDQNKIAGVDILSGVKTHHVIGLAGIGISKKTDLESVLANDSRVITFVLSEDGTSVIIDSKAVFTKEEFEMILQQFNGTITGYAAEYSL